jgi:hypothetical protein
VEKGNEIQWVESLSASCPIWKFLAQAPRKQFPENSSEQEWRAASNRTAR